MFDTVIKGGTIVDGDGAEPYASDIALMNGKIVEIGRITGASRHVLDADGAILTPGFIDPHSHFDGQFTWDDRLDPAFPHGITTVVGGNCGVGFAPVRAEHRAALIDLMDGVEDIPELVLTEGLRWNWESFPDYLDLLSQRQYTMDVGVQMTHAPLRVHVMGDRALRHEAATGADIAAMCTLVHEGMRAGALGFSAARLVEHRARSGAMVPGTFAETVELLALAETVGSTGRGVLQIVLAGAVGQHDMAMRQAEHDLAVELCLRAGRPLTYLLQQSTSHPEDWRQFLNWSTQAQANGVPIFPQFSARGVGLLMSLDGPHLFQARPSYMRIAHVPLGQRIAMMRDPHLRARILSEEDNGDLTLQGGLGTLRAGRSRLFAIDDHRDYEPDASLSFGTLAAAEGKDIDAFIYDFLVSDPAGPVAAFFALNYSNGNLDHVRDLLASAATLAGLGDGGAHSRMICDASLTTFALAFWARDRQRGATLPLEAVVRKLTSQPADFYGMADRGRIRVGLRADINIIDFDNLRLHRPRTAADLPAGGSRVHQAASGYLATLVAGVPTRLADEDTGARPGRLIRGVTGGEVAYRGMLTHA